MSLNAMLMRPRASPERTSADQGFVSQRPRPCKFHNQASVGRAGHSTGDSGEKSLQSSESPLRDRTGVGEGDASPFGPLIRFMGSFSQDHMSAKSDDSPVGMHCPLHSPRLAVIHRKRRNILDPHTDTSASGISSEETQGGTSLHSPEHASRCQSQRNGETSSLSLPEMDHVKKPILQNGLSSCFSISVRSCTPSDLNAQAQDNAERGISKDILASQDGGSQVATTTFPSDLAVSRFGRERLLSEVSIARKQRAMRSRRGGSLQ